MRVRALLSLATVCCVAATLTVTASGAPKVGCPSGDWEQLTIQQVATRVYPTLLDKSPWPGGINDFRDNAVAPLDKNGEGSICIKQQWGEDLNPNSRWWRVGFDVLGSPTVLTLARDNNANASNT